MGGQTSLQSERRKSGLLRNSMLALRPDDLSNDMLRKFGDDVLRKSRGELPRLRIPTAPYSSVKRRSIEALLRATKSVVLRL